MKSEIDCKIIKDLLPLYMDKLASDSSVRAIKEHLEECQDCRNVLEKMERPLSGHTKEEEKELDFLKKIRRRNKRVLKMVLILSTLILAVVLAVVVKVFIIGMPISPESITYECFYDEEKRELTVHGVINLNMTEFSGLSIKEDPYYVGVLNLEVRGADRYVFEKKYKTEFTGTIKIPDDDNNWRVDLVGPSYQRFTVWDSFRMEDLTDQELAEYMEAETRVTSKQVLDIKPEMTSSQVQELLGPTVGTYERGSLNYTLGYIVDDEYTIQIEFSTLDEDQPCGMTGEEILSRKTPRA